MNKQQTKQKTPPKTFWVWSEWSFIEDMTEHLRRREWKAVEAEFVSYGRFLERHPEALKALS